MFSPLIAYNDSDSHNLVVRYLSLLFLGKKPHTILTLTLTNRMALVFKKNLIYVLETLESSQELNEISEIVELPTAAIISKRDELLEELLNAELQVLSTEGLYVKLFDEFASYMGLDENSKITYIQTDEREMFFTLLQKQNRLKDFYELAQLLEKRDSDVIGLLENLYRKKSELSGLKFDPLKFHNYERRIMNIHKKLETIVLGSGFASRMAIKAIKVDGVDDFLNNAWMGRETFDYRVFKKIFVPEMDVYLYEIQALMKKYIKGKEEYAFYLFLELLEVYSSMKYSLAKESKTISPDVVEQLISVLIKDLHGKKLLDEYLQKLKIEHVILDSANELTPVQYETLISIFTQVLKVPNSSLMIQGDKNQSLFSFRGARKEFFTKMVSLCNLKLSRESRYVNKSKNVVSFINKFFKPQFQEFIPLKSNPQTLDGYGGAFCVEDVMDEAGDMLERLLERGVSGSDIVVIAKSNGDANRFHGLLKEKNIDTYVFGNYSDQVLAIVEYVKYVYDKNELCLYNFFSLIKRPYEELLYPEESSTDLLELVLSLVDKYKLDMKDKALLEFMHKIMAYKNIEDFINSLNDIPLYDTGVQGKGVLVSTQHRFMGMSSKYVIVLDNARSRMAVAPKGSVLFKYEDEKLQKTYIRSRNRQSIDFEYANVLEVEKEEEIQTQKNLIYSSFMCAKETLIVIQAYKASRFDVIDLEECEIGALNEGI